MFTDTHCHLLNIYYDDLNEIINNAKLEGIYRYINCSYDKDSMLEVLSTLNIDDNLYGVIGIHPSEASKYSIEDLNLIEDNIKNIKVIAIGEIGLDYHYGKEYINEQKDLFRKQLKIAEDNNIPVVIHSRDATEDTINILKEYHVKGVIHSFSGSLETAKIYLKMGFILGINGVVTFKNSHLIEVLKALSLKDFILETDCPYLTPSPYRGITNEPKHIIDIVNYLINNLSITKDELSLKTEANIKRIFDI